MNYKLFLTIIVLSISINSVYGVSVPPCLTIASVPPCLTIASVPPCLTIASVL